MTRDELLTHICPYDRDFDCTEFEEKGCKKCNKYMNEVLDEYDKHIRAEVIGEIRELMKQHIELENVKEFVEALSKLKEKENEKISRG